MAVQQEDIDALTQALATGERVVRKGNNTVEYRSVAEIIAARNALMQQKAAEDAAQSGRTVSRQTRLVHGGRGF